MPRTHITKRLISWASILDPQTEEQARLASTMPFVFPHIALMPDAHLGKGATVGSVIPTQRAIIPAAVGVDIGCGMDAVRTQFTGAGLRATGSLTSLRTSIEAAVPLSAGVSNTALTTTARARIAELESLAQQADFDPDQVAASWRMQLGSLGSGNHFIEMSVDEQDRAWAFLHSGSRGVGNRIATRHIEVAQTLCRQWWIDLPDPDLAYLVEGTEEFWAYIRALRWAQDYARLNRAEMMDRVLDCVSDFAGEAVQRKQTVSCHHNYTEQETHWGRQVWVSRKGAINAAEGVWGLIPGSMGTRSYVVQGTGDAVSLHSAPHGAGREHSRSSARRTFSTQDLARAMEGIEWSGSAAFLDEIPAAYKPIDVVMADAGDLVQIRHTLSQILNVKGD